MYIYIVLLIFSVQIVHANVIDTPLSIEKQNLSTPYEDTNKTELSMEEKMKDFRIQILEYQLRHLRNVKEKSEKQMVKERPSEAVKQIIKLLMKEEEEWQQKQTSLYNRPLNNEERLVIHAKKHNLKCIYLNATYCRLYNFGWNESLVQNALSVDLWVYKRAKHPKQVWIALPSSSSNDENEYDAHSYKANDDGWNKLPLPNIFTSLSWNESSYPIEISGDYIENSEDLRPFLLVTKLDYTIVRQRRDATCNANSSCCWKPLTVSFAEIGFDWVLYPSELEANMCSGKCMNDPSKTSSHYEMAMINLLENNSAMKSSLGDCWTLCCKPKELDAVRVLYNDTDGIIHDQYIPDLSVKSCGCS